MTTYTAWDDKEYPWPPPNGWYVAGDGKWWPEGYGPGEGASTAPGAALPDPPPNAGPQGYAQPAQNPQAMGMPNDAAYPAPTQVPQAQAPQPFAGAQAPPVADVSGPVVGAPPSAAAGDGGGSGKKIFAIVAGLLALVGIGIVAIVALVREDSPTTEATAESTLPPATAAPTTAAPTDSQPPDTQPPDTQPPDTQPEETQPETTEPESSDSTVTADQQGTLDNPYQVGDRVVIFYDDFDTGEQRNWLVEVLGSPTDITQAVLDENQFNDPPPEGSIFAAVPVRVTYQSGPVPANLFDLNFNAVGPSGVVFKTFEQSCGVTPNELETFAELFPDGTVEGNVCWAIPASDLDDLTMIVEVIFIEGQVYIDLN